MTETFYRTGTCKVNPSEFGGRICASDFDRKITLSEAAARIIADRRFDRQCRRDMTDNGMNRGTPLREQYPETAGQSVRHKAG